MLDTKDLIQDSTHSFHARDDNSAIDLDLGLLSFDLFFQHLSMPNLVRFDLRGWCYMQQEMQQFLAQQARSLRELGLIDNMMVQGTLASLADFPKDRLSLVSVEVQGRGALEGFWRRG